MALIGTQKFDQDEVRVIQGGDGDTTIEAGGGTWRVTPGGASREAVYAIVVRQFAIQGYKASAEDGTATTLQRHAVAATETAGPTADYIVERTDGGGADDANTDNAAAEPDPFVTEGFVPHGLVTDAGAAEMDTPQVPMAAPPDDNTLLRSGNFPAEAAAEALGLVRTGNKIGAIKLLRDADPSLSLTDAKEMVDGMATDAPPAPFVPDGGGFNGAAADANFGLPPQVAGEVTALLRAGKKIEAIKMVHNTDHDMGLKVAKELTDEAQKRMGIPNSGGRGCVGVLIFALTMAGVLGIWVSHTV